MKRRNAIRVILGLLAALLAFKFGCFIGNGEQANFPGGVLEWLIFTGWPCYLAPAFCGAALMAVVALASWKAAPNRSAIAPALWVLPILAGLIGLVNSTEHDYATQWLLHFMGAAAFCTAFWLAANNDTDFLPLLSYIIGIIGIVSCLQGWYQHFIGLEEAREFAIRQMQERGLAITPQILEKMAQTRIYGNYIDPNVYASHILFCAPFALHSLHSWGRKLEQPKAGSIVLTSIGAVIFACALFWSGSRGAAIGLAAGIAAAVWSLKPVRNWKWRWCIPAIGALGAIVLAAAFMLLKSRDGMASASARIIYYKTSLEIFLKHPLAGAGLGEFFPWYVRLKPMEAEITRDPHNMLLSFMVQTGIVGALVALLIILFPWLAMTFKDKSRDDCPLQIAAATALAAWLVHSMFQFNEIFPGTLYLAAACSVFIIPPSAEAAPTQSRSARAIATLAFLCGAICLLALMRVPGERLLRQGELQDSERPGNGLPSFVTATVMLPHAIMPPKSSFSIYYAKGDWPKAAEAAEALVQRSPHRASSLNRLALVQMAMGRLDDASATLAKSIEWFPSCPDTLVALAVLKYRQGKSLTLMENSLLARQTYDCKAWCHDKGDHVLVTFQEDNNSLLSGILKDATVEYMDGRKVVFEPIDPQVKP